MFVVMLLVVCLCRCLWCCGCVNSVVINKLKIKLFIYYIELAYWFVAYCGFCGFCFVYCCFT